ncbi:DUF4328 domain-containing protein [Streptosporangium roseum]|uniref:DUF4328 domain-containing protein n=1 Tax=Streptosporangium roseum (strain ATCC 12428 / DSM 43021 / JCM 3005 / KCTC 9067 / NCIMB 10171 / NRRL 2505 / NI 9100) TaxID=479432 RepID=D2AX92_STRRD|nr:DUF4328 domain-containing protein [Streptosporangium roseum]ACZ90819.1 hypothetical protein Sros_8168 [Streptosporangium roseum DSM 43021]
MRLHPPPPRPLRPLRESAVVAVTALGAAALAEIVWVLAGSGLTSVLDRTSEGPSLRSIEDLLPLVTFLVRVLGTSVAVVWLFLVRAVAAIAFLVWLFRARANAESLTPVPHRWFRILIVLGWALPVVNWWIPKQIMDDVWASSRPGGVRGEHIGREAHSGLIWSWWVSWLLGSWVLPLVGVLLFAGGDRSSSGGAFWLDVFTLAPTLAAAALAGTVILRITKAQEGRRAWAAGLPPP